MTIKRSFVMYFYSSQFYFGYQLIFIAERYLPLYSRINSYIYSVNLLGYVNNTLIKIYWALYKFSDNRIRENADGLFQTKRVLIKGGLFYRQAKVG